MIPPLNYPQTSRKKSARTLFARVFRPGAVVLTLLWLLPLVAAAQSFRSGVVYELESQVAPGMALDVASASTASGANVQIWTYGGGNNQKWKAIDVGGGYWSFAPLHAPDKRLNVGGASSANGANVTQSTSNGTTAQKWKAYSNGDGTYSLEPQCAPGKRLNVAGGGTANGTNVEIWASSGVASQKWKFIPLPGTYRPDGTTTGPIPGTTLTTVSGDFNVTANNQLVQNLDINGRLNTGAFSNVVVRNCIIRGTAMTGADTETYCIISANDNSRGLLVEDCRIVGRGNPWCSATGSGNYTIRRTEISNTPDGLGLRSALGNVTAEACWIHNGYFLEWDATTPNRPAAGGYYTHVDGVQFHRGKNYVFRGNMIGGVRAPYDHHSGHQADIQAADDMYNAAFMIKQEVDNSLANKIENVLIEDNWLEGGASTINMASGRDNDFSSTTIRNNRFIRSTWGAQYYILRPPGLGVFTNNVFDDDGTPVPITTGA